MGRASFGQIVSSKSGRDFGRIYIVVGIIDENYLLLSDGKFRRLDNLKKKNQRHLVLHRYIDNNLKRTLTAGEKVTNQQIRRALDGYHRLANQGREEGSTVHGER